MSIALQTLTTAKKSLNKQLHKLNKHKIKECDIMESRKLKSLELKLQSQISELQEAIAILSRINVK